MIQQRIGDLLAVDEGGKPFYVVVLTKVVMFGGNILFAFHNDGLERDINTLGPEGPGFNICADLLAPKRDGRVRRLRQFDSVAGFWRTRYAKLTNEHRLGVKAKEWFIYRIDDLAGQHIARTGTLTEDYRRAMDAGCDSFDLVASKVLARYTPEQNPHI